MKDHDPRSTRLGKKLSEIIGNKLDTVLRMVEKSPFVEVDVESLPRLNCRKVIFVNLLPWDEQHSEPAVQVIWRVQC